MEPASIFGVLLLSAGAISVACGLYSIQGNIKIPLNRTFFVLSVSILIWSLGLAITIGGATEAISSIGRRLAPFGWGTVMSFLLHFFLILTGYTRLLERVWGYVLIYWPAAVTIFAYTLLPLFGLNPDILVMTKFGWMNIAHSDFWDWFYYSYFLLFLLICVALLILWSRRSDNRNVKLQSRLLIVSLLIGAVGATLIDIVPVLLGLRLPQFSPIAILLPVLAVSYSVLRHELMKPEKSDQNELILKDSTRKSSYLLLSLSFILGCVLYQVAGGFQGAESLLFRHMGFNVLLLLLAASFFVIYRSKFDDKFKELLISGIFSCIIPIVTVLFLKYGSITIWSIVFPPLLVSLLFNRRLLLSTLLVATVSSHLFVWAAIPHIMVMVNSPHYLIRISILVFSAIVAFYVNQVYVARLKESSYQIDTQMLTAEISRDLVLANDRNFDEKIFDLLQRCGAFVRSDRAYLILLDAELDKVAYSREWHEKDKPTLLPHYEETKYELQKRLVEIYGSQKLLQIADVAEMPEEEEEMRQSLQALGIRSLLLLPIRRDQAVIGYWGFDSDRPMAEWNIESTTFLEIINNTIADAIRKIEAEREINFIAYHDQLTRLPNRVLFKDRLMQAIRLASRTEKMIAVVFLDIDSFKSVNDTMGHDLGDQVLFEVAKTLKQNIRGYDAVARFGGDEFVLMLNQIASTKDLINIMDKIMEMNKKPLLLQGQEFFISTSAGVALYPQDGSDAETLIKNADTAMYNAKAGGKNRYVLCSKDMKDQVLERMRLTNLLYRAREREQLFLHYQPQVNVADHAIVGFEALLRWSLPGYGMISPVTFIPLAEQTGLIHSIGEWVLQTACRQNRYWQDMGFPDLRIGVNISVHQLKNPGFVAQVERALQQSGLAPRFLELEVTESIASNYADNILTVLNSLKELGVSISIDDFGTEYSSLGRLKMLPIDRIKMDMQFVQGLEKNEKDQAITKVIISLAKSLNLKVVAEGVETKPQLDFLSRKMCDEVQGYYYFRPMPAEEVEKVLLKGLGLVLQEALVPL